MRVEWVILVCAGMALGLGQADPASAQAPEAASATPGRRIAIDPGVAQPVNPRIRRALPDMTCSVQAWEDQAKTKPIANGAQLAYGGGLPGAWIEASTKNTGPATAAMFNVSLTVNNGGLITTQNYLVPGGLGNGMGYHFPIFEIKFGNKTTQIQASATTDAGGAVGEASESNNACSLSFSATVVQ